VSRMRKDLQRNADLAAIHVGKKKLGLDDDLYREFLFATTGHRSASELDSAQRRLVIERMRARGFKKILPRPADNAQDRMARALYHECVKSGALRDRDERGFLKLVKRITGIDRLEWMNAEDANKVIEALKSIKRRQEVAAEAEEGGAHR
jgi:phage gp16-like protein